MKCCKNCGSFICDRHLEKLRDYRKHTKMKFEEKELQVTRDRCVLCTVESSEGRDVI